MEDCIDSLGGAKWYCTLDLQAGYWQVDVDPADREKTAFCTRTGLFEFNVLPFGLSNAPATFERLMETVLQVLQWSECLVYLDDIVIFGSTFDETLDRLVHVLDRLATAGLKLKPRKCALFHKQVAFLGHVISLEGVSTQTEKVEAVKSWPIPKSKKEVRSFLGLVGYYRRFIKGFANIARPLTKLTGLHEKFKWTDDCQAAFEQLKSSLMTAPILGYPRPIGQIIVDTDASGEAVGAVLSQVQDGKRVVLAYLSKALTPAEQNYCVTRRELLALVTASKAWHPYLFGRPVIIRTDNSVVVWAKRLKNPVNQMAR